MGMCDALDRLRQQLGLGSGPDFARVRVFVIGDGTSPHTAAALGLFLPAHVKLWSIDPIMDPGYCSVPLLSGRIVAQRCKSQDFEIPAMPPAIAGAGAAAVDVVVACHSHAPLQE